MVYTLFPTSHNIDFAAMILVLYMMVEVLSNHLSASVCCQVLLKICLKPSEIIEQT